MEDIILFIITYLFYDLFYEIMTIKKRHHQHILNYKLARSKENVTIHYTIQCIVTFSIPTI